uniref:Uncharacterized protein n=1 Tax=Tetranychus urticae TaxID=32264 RepID=T1KPR4_TETUR
MEELTLNEIEQGLNGWLERLGAERCVKKYVNRLSTKIRNCFAVIFSSYRDCSTSKEAI